MGYTPPDQLEAAIKFGCRIVAYNNETVDVAAKISQKLNIPARLHIKLETGNNRQGVLIKDAVKFAKKILSMHGLILEGAATHFANIEDTTDHSYAHFQFKNFIDAVRKIENECKIKIPIKHCANTAATMLFPKTHLDMVRVGIGMYGLWPSKETYVSMIRKNRLKIKLEPVLSWKTRIAQIKEIPENSYIGYGCTYKTTSKTKLAILPIGYYDGYDRKLSNNAYVLIRGKRAQIRGRVCMNIAMADVTDIPSARLDDEVVLIGRQGAEYISADQIADWCGTINYEITTRILERVKRIVV